MKDGLVVAGSMLLGALVILLGLPWVLGSALAASLTLAWLVRPGRRLREERPEPSSRDLRYVRH